MRDYAEWWLHRGAVVHEGKIGFQNLHHFHPTPE